MIRTICTISPSTPDLKGVDVARINGSFGTSEEIALSIARARKNMGSAIIVDLPRDRKKKRTNNYSDDNILKIAVEEKIDMIGLSYVKDHNEVDEIKKKVTGSGIKIVPKIETKEAIENVDSIIQSSDGIMIDRGDLASAIGIEMLARAQKRIIRKCNQYGKEVIVATELLMSMQDNQEPTKAEILDIANAISDGADYLMLSEETAVGKYPQQAVDVLKRLIGELDDAYKVIILAAGSNPALGALTAKHHTCLVDVGGKTILETQLDSLRADGIHDEDIIIATGNGDDFVRDKIKATDIKTVFNPWYDTTNMLATIWLAREQLSKGFIVIYGDIVFEPEILKNIINNKNDIVLAVEQKGCDEEDEKICVSNGQMILHSDYEGLPEPVHKCMPCSDAYGEFIGMAKFNRQGAMMLFNEMDDIMRKRKYGTYFMTALEQMVKKGVTLSIQNINGLLWSDNDTIYDIKNTREEIYPSINKIMKETEKNVPSKGKICLASKN